MNSTFRAVVFSFFFFNNVCKFLPTVLRTLFPTCLRIQRLYQQMCFTHSTCCVLPGFSLFSFVDTAAFTLYTHLANLSNTFLCFLLPAVFCLFWQCFSTCMMSFHMTCLASWHFYRPFLIFSHLLMQDCVAWLQCLSSCKLFFATTLQMDMFVLTCCISFSTLSDCSSAICELVLDGTTPNIIASGATLGRCVQCDMQTWIWPNWAAGEVMFGLHTGWWEFKFCQHVLQILHHTIGLKKPLRKTQHLRFIFAM